MDATDAANASARLQLRQGMYRIRDTAGQAMNCFTIADEFELSFKEIETIGIARSLFEYELSWLIPQDLRSGQYLCLARRREFSQRHQAVDQAFKI